VDFESDANNYINPVMQQKRIIKEAKIDPEIVSKKERGIYRRS
jgi:hypothetical protein